MVVSQLKRFSSDFCHYQYVLERIVTTLAEPIIETAETKTLLPFYSFLNLIPSGMPSPIPPKDGLNTRMIDETPCCPVLDDKLRLGPHHRMGDNGNQLIVMSLITEYTSSQPQENNIPTTLNCSTWNEGLSRLVLVPMVTRDGCFTVSVGLPFVLWLALRLTLSPHQQ